MMNHVARETKGSVDGGNGIRHQCEASGDDGLIEIPWRRGRRGKGKGKRELLILQV